METTEILRHILPKAFVEHFDLTAIESQGDQLAFSLDEKNIVPPECQGFGVESKGFISAIQITDFPIRDKRVILRVRRRKWRDKQTGKTFTRTWDLKAEGTSYTKEFAAFLKGIS